jgi:hypothetical protein
MWKPDDSENYKVYLMQAVDDISRCIYVDVFFCSSTGAY